MTDSANEATLTEAEAEARAQKALDDSVALFSSIATKAIKKGGRKDHPLVQAAQVEVNRVAATTSRIGRGTIPMSDVIQMVHEINDATERLVRDMH